MARMSTYDESPQEATNFYQDHYYYFNRPHEAYGSKSDVPPPPTADFEVIEEVATVFDNLIYNETGGGNDGQVVITQT